MAKPDASAALAGRSRKQWVLLGLALAVAFGFLTLGAIYDAPRSTGPVFTGGPVDGGGDRNDPDLNTAELVINPIESFLPRSGVGSTCSEPVGVDLIPGWSATLRINGVDLGPDQVTSGIGTAGGSLGHFTYGPEEDCPNGALLRPLDNLLEVCVYRNVEGPDSCRIETFRFDAL